MKNNKSFVYNPAQKTKGQLVTEFVVRTSIFENLLDDIKTAQRIVSPQHYLIAGQRGMGKTTLLLRLMYAIEDNPELKNYIIPIRFSEEQYNIGRLENLWEEAALLLAAKEPIYHGLYDEMLKYENDESYERVCFEIFEKKVKQQNHRVLFLIDNIGDLFEKFPPLQNNRLREVMMTCPFIQIIGSSSKILENTFHYDKPFFEFFYQIKLEPIDQKGTLAVLRALGKENKYADIIEDIIKKNPTRIDVLRRITGGVPRTIVLLFDIFMDNQNGNAFEDLLHLLDEVNSLYKHRMDDLKPQQQQIIDALARAWEPISAHEVLEKSKLYRDNMRSNQVSAQLKQLSDNQVVEIIEEHGRKNMYRIRERFFNIWYLMRHGRKQNKEEVLWLVKFLEAWCSIKDLNEMVEDQIKSMKSGIFNENAAYYKTLALHEIKNLDIEIKRDLLVNTEMYLAEKGHLKYSEAINKLRIETLNSIDLKKLNAAIDNKDSDKTEKILFDLVNNGRKDFTYSLGLFYNDIRNNYTEAEKYFILASKEGNIAALDSLGSLYKLINKDYNKSECFYLKAVEKGYETALFNLALLYIDGWKDYEKAETYYLQAAEKGNVKAMFNLAVLYYEIFKDYTKAEQYYLMAIEKGNNNAMNNIAFLYKEVKLDYPRAEEYFLKAIENGNIKANLNLALFYTINKKDLDKAEIYYLKAIEYNLPNALFNLAVLYHNEKRNYAKAEMYYLKAIEDGDKNAMYNLALLYYETNKDNKKAEYYYLKSIENNSQHFKSLNNLVVLYLNNKDLTEALKWAEKLFKIEGLYSDTEIVIYLIKDFIVHQQYNFLLKLFQEENSLLMKHTAPLYYVLAYFMKEELPGVYAKAGAEIKETVDEIIKAIEESKKIITF